MNTYTVDIKNFIEGPVRNTWIHYPNMAIYVRKGTHRINEPGYAKTLDVANVVVAEVDRGKGIFTQWLTLAEDEAKKQGLTAVFVESILNPRLIGHLEKLGYTRVLGSEPPSYFLKV